MPMYTPPAKVLKNYADVLIKFALWSGRGAQKGDVICVSISESARPFLPYIQRSIIESGAHMILQYGPDGLAREFFELASEDQLTWTPTDYMLERVKTATHFVGIISEADKHELEGIEGLKLMQRQKSMKFYMDARRDKEDMGKLTWTLGLYGTSAMASEVHMTEEEYWGQIVKACYLDYEDPIAEWRKVFDLLDTTKNALNNLAIESLHVKGENVDLTVRLGKGRQWLGGSGRNIPSFELFISPDWRGTEGWIQFDQPLYRYGNLIKGVRLEFKDGVVTKAEADTNVQVLQEMIKVENADKIGEFSLTDKKLSRITRFMGETLYDENVGGPYGNTHIALGAAYRDSYPGDLKTMSDSEWEMYGYNDSAVHTDIVSTTNRTVTATLADGTQKVIYDNGEFVV